MAQPLIDEFLFDPEQLDNDETIIMKRRQNLRAKADLATEKRCNTLICVLENPSNLGNMGAVIRNINCLGVGKLYVITDDPKSFEDMRKDKLLRMTSSSANKWTYVKCFKTTQECLDHLAKNNFKSLVTSPHIKGKENYSLYTHDFNQYPKLAIWFGNETRGISNLAIEKSDGCLSIPMYGIIESLNLSVSSAIVLSYVGQKRREYTGKT